MPPTLDPAALDALGEGHAVVCDGVLGSAVLDAWLARATALDRAGRLTAAGLGASGERITALRADHTAFLADDPEWADVVGWFAELGQPLSAGLRLALPAFSLQLAAFPPGGGYVRHLDTIRGDPSRRITATLYLDRTWTADDGGALRVAEPGGERDLLPVGGRLVVFRSDAVAHEVLPTRRIRFALTAWFGSRGAIG